MSKFEEYQTFVTIVEKGSLVSAAKALHLSPSAVSKKLALLEEGLGVQLIDRSTRSLSVTDAGEGFYRDCKNILLLTMQAEERLMESLGDVGGKLRLTCPRVMVQPRFLKAINQFRHRYPKIKVDLSVSDAIQDLVQGDIDFAFRVGALKNSGLQALTLFQARGVLCASPEYLAHYGAPVDLQALKKHNVILPTYLNLSEKMSMLITGQMKLDVQQFDTTDDVHALYHRIREGGGISMLLDLMVGDDIERGDLINVFPGFSLPAQPVTLLWCQQKNTSKKIEVFKNFMREYFITPF